MKFQIICLQRLFNTAELNISRAFTNLLHTVALERIMNVQGTGRK